MTMHAKILKLGSLFFGAALASLGSAAHAENINTQGTICRNLIAGQAEDLEYGTAGVDNHNASPRVVVCAIPRSPLQPGATPKFYVDGWNSGTNTTPCTLYTTSFDGTTITQAFSFTGTGTYDQPVIFAANGVGTYDYASVICTLPGSGGGLLFGVTSVQ